MVALLLAVIYFAFIGLGLPDSMVGCAWPEMYVFLDTPKSYLGIITMLIAGSTIVSSLLADKLTIKFGPGLISAISTLLVGLAMFLFSQASAFWMVCLVAIPYGLGAGAIDTALNNYVALHYSSRSMSFLHSFWGVGAIISPYVMSYALAKYKFQSGFYTLGGLEGIIGLLLLAALPIWVKANKEDVKKGKEEVKQNSLTFKEKLALAGLPLFLLSFFAENAIENTLMTWTPSFLVFSHNISAELAASLCALYFYGLTASRVIFGLLGHYMNDKQRILSGSLFLGIGVILLLLPFSNNIFLYISLCILGFGIGPIFPSYIHSCPFLFKKENSLAVVGILMAAGYCGSTFMPLVFGLIADLLSISLLPLFIVLFFVIMVLTALITFKRVEKKN